MKYGLALFPSETLQELANSFRMRYDTHYSLVPPHITINEGFDLADSEIKRTVETIRTISSQYEPVQIEVYKIDTFFPLSNTIYFKIRQHESLMNLTNILHEKLFKETKYRCIPHLAIGRGLSNDEHADIIGRLKMKELMHQETIYQLQLLVQQENAMWSVYETFSLGIEKQTPSF